MVCSTRVDNPVASCNSVVPGACHIKLAFGVGGLGVGSCDLGFLIDGNGNSMFLFYALSSMAVSYYMVLLATEPACCF